MLLTIVTAICGAPEITKQWLHETVGRCQQAPNLVIVSNGSTDEELQAVADEALVVWQRWGSPEQINDYRRQFSIIREPEPLGSTKPLNIGIGYGKGDVVACLHNDLMVKEAGWDQQVLAFFASHPNAGVVGFHGSKALADDRIYQIPYELPQLARGWSCSNMEDAEAHGARVAGPERVITLDGMALIASFADLSAWGGFDERYTHHMYDHDLCLTSLRHGRENWLLPISVRHISGQTANQPRYNEHFADKGRDAGIHAQAHLDFYEKWKGTGMLPARLIG